MNSRITLPALTLIAFLILGVGQANATFPGKNGRIAFVQGPDIFTMNPDGSDVRQLTNLGPDSGAFWESWSADGKQIVFNEFRPPDFLGQLWLMNADGSNQHVLLAAPDFEDERPSFTPDGGAVIFTRCRLDLPDTCALYQIDVKGGGLTAVTNFDLGIVDLDGKYSADGALAFIGVGRRGIFCATYLGADSPSGLSRITPAALWAHMPDWSPDGKKVAFTTHCTFDSNLQNQEIWVVNAEKHLVKRLTRNGHDYFAGPHDFSPSWSPQGDAIVFERDAPDFSSSSIVIMKADGSSSKKLLTLRSSSRTNRPLSNRIHELRMGAAKSRLKAIEEGGVLPQWGVAPQ
jgi:Tol biopolymer transport system component